MPPKQTHEGEKNYINRGKGRDKRVDPLPLKKSSNTRMGRKGKVNRKEVGMPSSQGSIREKIKNKDQSWGCGIAVSRWQRKYSEEESEKKEKAIREYSKERSTGRKFLGREDEAHAAGAHVRNLAKKG